MLLRRRLTVSLDGSSSEVKVTKLMKNDDEYFAVSKRTPCMCSCITS